MEDELPKKNIRFKYIAYHEHQGKIWKKMKRGQVYDKFGDYSLICKVEGTLKMVINR